MEIEKIKIESRDQWLALRRQDITASIVGGLLGVSDYATPYGLYALKTGLVEEDAADNAAMKRGRLLEPVALELLQEDRPTWWIERPNVYLRDPSIRLGATPDAYARNPDRAGFGIVQVKTTVDMIFRQKWRDPDTHQVTPPLWIVVQALTEAHLAGASWACVAVLVVGFGLELHVIEIPIHTGLIARVREATADFWRAVADGTPPDPDFVRDGETIARAFADDDGGEVDLSEDNRIGELLAERAKLKAREADGNAAVKERKTVDSEIIFKLGNSTRGRLADGTTVEAKTVRRGAYEVQPTSYRTVNVKTLIGRAKTAPISPPTGGF